MVVELAHVARGEARSRYCVDRGPRGGASERRAMTGVLASCHISAVRSDALVGERFPFPFPGVL